MERSHIGPALTSPNKSLSLDPATLVRVDLPDPEQVRNAARQVQGCLSKSLSLRSHSGLDATSVGSAVDPYSSDPMTDLAEDEPETQKASQNQPSRAEADLHPCSVASVAKPPNGMRSAATACRSERPLPALSSWWSALSRMASAVYVKSQQVPLHVGEGSHLVRIWKNGSPV